MVRSPLSYFPRGIERSILLNSDDEGGIDTSLPVTLSSGTITSLSRTVVEGMSLEVDYLDALETMFSGLGLWSQLSLDSVASTPQYYEKTNAVVVDRELVQADFGSTFNWHGVHQNRNQAGVPEDINGDPIFSSVFYSIDDDEPFLYVSALGGIWSGYLKSDCISDAWD